ncbi:hypothetical protein WSM22_44270 [Cytophagales bacterium WSM2-2]|nr:hypothetical protein WSM22_44270 [Cytophagales bacterium WSM2-2]
MKTLADHTIIYDKECPLCCAYTGAFVKTGMLDTNGREAYSEMDQSNTSQVDWNRARNEIAMINRKDNTVKYGIDSLLAIVEHSFPFLKQAFEFRLLYFSLRQLYFFISYNRKVIAPGKVFEADSACTPDFSTRYRWAYIVFAWLVTSFVLVHYFRLAAPVIQESGFAREFMVCAGQLVFQGAFVFQARKDRLVHYFGNMMTVSLMGALALSPVLLLKEIINSPWVYIGYFMVVVGFMFFEHKRRVRILNLPVLISFTWILYRFIVLPFIL